MLARQGKAKEGNTHNMRPRGSTSARCCMLRYRSRNKLPVGYDHSVSSSHEMTQRYIIMSTAHLKATQTLAELLAELHVYFSLAHYMFAKLLSRETALREERLSLCTPFCCDLGTRCLRPVCGFA